MRSMFLKYGKNIGPLDKYKKNYYSQNGEDGVINEIFTRIGLNDFKSMWVVEFGAWDGVYLSNTFSLVERGANAVFIEGDANKYVDLLSTTKRFPKIKPVNKFVEYEIGSKNKLDLILEEVAELPLDFEVLSIDIDSFDLEVWETLNRYNPKIVIIEINSSIPVGVESKHSQTNSGGSFTSALMIGECKGYKLVSHIGNLIFVRNDFIDKLQIEKKYISNPEVLFNDFWSNMSKAVKFFDWSTSFFCKKILRRS